MDLVDVHRCAAVAALLLVQRTYPQSTTKVRLAFEMPSGATYVLMYPHTTTSPGVLNGDART